MTEQSIVLVCRDYEDIDDTINDWTATVTITTIYGINTLYVENIGQYVIVIFGDWT